MTKDSFLTKLNFHLLFKLPTPKRKSVLQDYRDFFDEGLTKGETEEALCDKFGSPAEIAREVSDDGSGKGNSVVLTIILLFLILLYLLPNEILYFAQISYRYVLTIASILITLLYAKASVSISKKAQSTVIAFFAVALMGFFAWCAYVFNIFSLNVKAISWSGMCYYISVVITVASLCALVINIKKISKKLFPLLSCHFYIIFALTELFIMMANVTSKDTFVPIQSLAVSALFMAPSLALSLYFSFRKDKV